MATMTPATATASTASMRISGFPKSILRAFIEDQFREAGISPEEGMSVVFVELRADLDEDGLECDMEAPGTLRYVGDAEVGVHGLHLAICVDTVWKDLMDLSDKDPDQKADEQPREQEHRGRQRQF